jgi:diguanylate cyclase (GGDEF)-like protein
MKIEWFAVGDSRLQHARKWTIAVVAVVCLHALLSLLAPRSFALTAFGDVTQSVLLLCATAAMLFNIKSASKKEQLFWGLMGLGCGMWCCAQLMWSYFEVLLRQDTPNPFVGDVVLFLHIVPITAAIALQPHVRQEERTTRAGSLDFLLLLIWWLYLYLLVVIPWQYVYPVESAYGSSFDVLYACEQIVLVFSLGLVWRGSKGAWRSIYAQLFGAALLYSISSIAASEAIDFHLYYTGSLFDVPLVAAMGWFAAIGFMARKMAPSDSGQEAPAQSHGIWKARLAMLAVFSTPLMIAWAEFGGNTAQRVRSYRLLLTIGVMILMGTLVFLKQHLLNEELLGVLRLSRQNLDEMCQLKDTLETKEKSLTWHSTELQRKNLELQQISFTDPLTGTWNRRYLEEILTPEAGQVLRNYQRVAGSTGHAEDHRDLVFLMVDVDFFKDVNDRHGHLAGDRLLQLVAERLAIVVRKSDVLVRWGGEEFLVMSRSTDPSGTPAFCSRILEVIAAHPFDLGNGISVRKTCSVGWAPYPWCRSHFEALCAEEVIALADIALYRAKALGRNQGIGALPSDIAKNTPPTITLESLQDEKSPLVRQVRTECPGRIWLPGSTVQVPEVVDSSGE